MKIYLIKILAGLVFFIYTQLLFSQIAFNKLSTFQAKGGFDESATEIIAYDSVAQKLASTNGALKRIDIIDISDISNPVLIDSIYLDSIGGGVNSVDVNPANGLIAAAVEADNKQDDGFVVFLDIDGNYIKKVRVGALPDMLTFSHDKSIVLVACEGEPSSDYSNDPEGEIAVIEIPGNVNDINQGDVTRINFNSFDSRKQSLINEGVRIFGGVTGRNVSGFYGEDDNDVDSVELTDASGVHSGNWITIDSDNTDDDADYVITYQVKDVKDNILILETEFEVEMDGSEFDEGTDILLTLQNGLFIYKIPVPLLARIWNLNI